MHSYSHPPSPFQGSRGNALVRSTGSRTHPWLYSVMPSGFTARPITTEAGVVGFRELHVAARSSGFLKACRVQFAFDFAKRESLIFRRPLTRKSTCVDRAM